MLAAPARAAVKNPGVFTHLATGEADSLDPAWAYDTASHLAIFNLYEPLFRFKKGSATELVPRLAARVPTAKNGLLSPDGRTYTIPIRTGVKFHDGAPMTPEDVRYSLLRFMLSDRNAGPASLLLDPLLGYPSTRDEKGALRAGAFADAARAVRVRGESVILTLPRPFAPLPAILASWAPIVSKKWVVQNGGWDGTEGSWRAHNDPAKESSPLHLRANGTGPFRLARWDRKTKEILLERFDGYWRAPAKLKNVALKTVPEFSTRKLMLLAGDADSISADRPALSQLKGLPGVRLIDDLAVPEVKPALFFTFTLNPSANPYIGSGRLDGDGIPPDFLADKDVRKGFAYAFDYAGYLADVHRGKGAQATGCIPPGLLGHNPRQEIYRLDLKKSAEHFKKAHGGRLWERGFRFILAYKTGSVPDHSLVQILKRHVESVNPKFRVDLRALDWPTLLDASTAGKLPAYVMGWSLDYPDAHSFAFPLMHSKGSYPLVQKYRNPEADRLVEAAQAEIRPERRRALYAQLQALEFEDVPHLLTLDSVRFRVQRDWVRGWSFDPVFPDAPYGADYYDLEKKD